MEANVTTETEQTETDRQISDLLDILRRVMSTLSKCAGSPEETAVWREANAFLVMHGRRP